LEPASVEQTNRCKVMRGFFDEPKGFAEAAIA